MILLSLLPYGPHAAEVQAGKLTSDAWHHCLSPELVSMHGYGQQVASAGCMHKK